MSQSRAAVLVFLLSGCFTPAEEGLPPESAPTSEDLPDPPATYGPGENGAETPTPPAAQPIETIDETEDPAPPPPPAEEPPPPPPAEEPPPPPPAPPADCPRVQVVNTGGDVLNVRADPSTAQPPLTVLAAGAIVPVLEVVEGQAISGNSRWYHVDAGTQDGFVSAAFTSCIAPGSAPPEAFLLPLPCGLQVRVTQGNNTDFSHTGTSAYAFDFGIPAGTPLLAIKAGVVIALDESTQPGDPCYSGGGQSCINEANTVTLRHDDGTTSIYAHVNSVEVAMGQQVPRGAVVALSGGTGWSTGPHAHVARQTDCGYAFCQSIAVSFADVGGDGVPASGDVVTSGNGCP